MALIGMRHAVTVCLCSQACMHHSNLAKSMLAACHVRSNQDEIAKCVTRKKKACNYSARAFLPILFGVFAGIISLYIYCHCLRFRRGGTILQA